MIKFRKRIVLIESDQKFRELAVSLLETSSQYVVVNAYEDCETAMGRLKKDFPDIIITGLEFPQMKGNEAISKIRKQFPYVDILVITDYQEEDTIFSALTAGANGYLIKSTSVFHLIDRLDELVDGGAPLSPIIARKLIDSIHVSSVSPLTNRESEVLKLITQGNSYSGIANQLNISKETSKTHIRNIYKKLNVRTRSEVVRKAFEERYVPYSAMSVHE